MEEGTRLVWMSRGRRWKRCKSLVVARAGLQANSGIGGRAKRWDARREVAQAGRSCGICDETGTGSPARRTER